MSESSARPVDDREGVSFVVAVHNGARWVDDVITAILAQDDGRRFEVLVVDDGSTDGSPAILARHAAAGTIRIIEGPGRGAAAAINAGILEAIHPIICQVDQDVIVGRGWMSRLTESLSAADVAAAQGYYRTPPDCSVWARVMGFDLEQRYRRIRGETINHVCTGNSAYRTAAIRQVGLFDESLGYGYDNDMSYRLADAGYRLVFCREAESIHRWRERVSTYFAQQYGVGYGRLDVIAKHRRRVVGDDVSGLGMILHVPLMSVACVALVAAAVFAGVGGPWRIPALCGAATIAAVMGERLIAGIHAAIYFRNLAGLVFMPAHFLRDVAWLFALVRWTADRLRGKSPTPTATMKRGVVAS